MEGRAKWQALCSEVPGVLGAPAARACWGGFVNSVCESDTPVVWYTSSAYTNRSPSVSHSSRRARSVCNLTEKGTTFFWQITYDIVGKKQVQVVVCPHSPLFTYSFSF